AVCGAHHRAVHRGELTITGNADQNLTFRDANGRTFGPAPPRPPTTPLADAAHQLGLHPRWTNRAGERAQWRNLNSDEPPPTANWPARRREAVAVSAPQVSIGLSHVERIVGDRCERLLELARAVEAAGADQLAFSEHVTLTRVITDEPGTSDGSFPFPG